MSETTGHIADMLQQLSGLRGSATQQQLASMMGHKVECDRITTAPRPRLQRCQPWESAHAAGDASARRERQTSSK